MNVGERPAAYIVYRVTDGHRVAFLVFDPRDSSSTLASDAWSTAARSTWARARHLTAAYRDRGLGYVVASDMDEDTLARLVIAFVRALARSRRNAAKAKAVPDRILGLCRHGLSQGDEMADRIALCIEPDTAHSGPDPKRLLEPRGFRVQNIPNGDDAMEWGRTNKPSVIILSVEPRKVGYAISQQAAAQPQPARGAAGDDLVGGDAGDVRAAQEAEVARRRIPAEAARGERVRVQGRGRSAPPAEVTATTTSTSWTPTRTSCSPKTTTSIVGSSDDDEEATALMGSNGERAGDTSEQKLTESDGHAGAVRRARSSIRRRRRRSRRSRRSHRNSRRRATTWSTCATCGRTTICPRTSAGSRPPRPGAGTAEASSDDDPYRTGETLGPELIDSPPAAAAAPLPVPRASASD